MKKFFALATLATSLLYGGWFSHDKEYYLSHLDEAKKKAKECKEIFFKAMARGDKAEAKEIQNDSECNAAFEAIKEHRKASFRKMIEERKARRAKEEAEYKKLYNKYKAEYDKMDYEELLRLDQKECKLFDSDIFGHSKTAAKCNAVKNAIKEREPKELEKIFAAYPKDRIEEYIKQKCKPKQGFVSTDLACNFAYKAKFAQERRAIEALKKDPERLKKIRNECIAKAEKALKAGKPQETQKIRNTFDCRTSAEAALRVFGHYGPFK